MDSKKSQSKLRGKNSRIVSIQLEVLECLLFLFYAQLCFSVGSSRVKIEDHGHHGLCPTMFACFTFYVEKSHVRYHVKTAGWTLAVWYF